MIQKLFGTKDDTATAILRLVLGIVSFPHGAQLMLGWLGASGFLERWVSSGCIAYSSAACRSPFACNFNLTGVNYMETCRRELLSGVCP